MLLLWLIGLFPLITAIGFAVLYVVLSRVRPARAGDDLARHGNLVYLALLCVPLAVAIPWAWEQSGALGVRLPHSVFSGMGAPGTLLLLLFLALLSGALLYYNELLLSVYLHRLLVRRKIPLHGIVEGGSPGLQRGTTAPSAWSFLGRSAAIAASEEFLWRGCLLHLLTTDLHLATATALAVSALLFGLNHLYHGLRNVLLKSIDGAVWGGLLLLSGSLLIPLVSHLTFQVFVWRRLVRRAERARASRSSTANTCSTGSAPTTGRA